MLVRRLIVIPILLTGGVALSGCASTGSLSGYALSEGGNYNAGTYSTGLQQQHIDLGRIVAVQMVNGRGGSTLGRIAGAIGGAALGHQVGGGVGRSISTSIGAIVGGLYGGRAEQRFTSRPVEQVTVRLHDGQVVGVVEGHYHFRRGQRVQVIHDPGQGYSSSTTRVLPL